METRQYLNYFSELKSMSAEEQLLLLEQARHQVYVVEDRQYHAEFGQTGAYFVTIFIALVPPYLLGFDVTINAICLGLGLIVSGFLSDWLEKRGQARILQAGLATVLQQKSGLDGKGASDAVQTTAQ